MEKRDSKNSKTGWACGLAKAGWRRKTTVLFSSFCLKWCLDGVRSGGLLNFYKKPREEHPTSNVLRSTSKVGRGLLSDDSSSASRLLFDRPTFTTRWAACAVPSCSVRFAKIAKTEHGNRTPTAFVQFVMPIFNTPCAERPALCMWSRSSTPWLSPVLLPYIGIRLGPLNKTAANRLQPNSHPTKPCQ